MAQWSELQRDFSGGEVSQRVAMRDDAEFHSKSLLQMENFIPTLQGTAVRSPGTRYVFELADLNARIFPYLSPANERSLVVMLPGEYSIYTNILETVRVQSLVNASWSRNTLTPVRVAIKDNWYFGDGLTGWVANPVEYESKGDTLGVFASENSSSVTFVAALRGNQKESAHCELTGVATVPEDCDRLFLSLKADYSANFSGPDADYTMDFQIGTTQGADDLWSASPKINVGETYEPQGIQIQGTFTAGQKIYMRCELTALSADGLPSSVPKWFLRFFGLASTINVDLGEADKEGTTPYNAEQLKNLQYVQSPYPDSASSFLGKELVFVHPDHPPQQIIFRSTGTPSYVFQQKVFRRRAGAENNPPEENPYEPPGWGPGNYPNAVTSFNGRLILAGGQAAPVLGVPTSSSTSETVWGTEVGAWNYFTAPNEADPDDSIEFTTIYRSPITWVFGQKQLLVGAVEMEYIASADGIFSPGDLGVSMHSTHGSSGIQPVGMGQTVLFAAEDGTKVRAMGFQQSDSGWLAPDLTLLHPELCNSSVKRMVRMRNPHQMAVCLLGNGQLAVLHQDTYAGVQGWSRIKLSGQIKDIAVVTDDKGVDILFCTVLRNVDGSNRLYLEAFVDWLDNPVLERWDYIQSALYLIADNATSTWTGLDHLEGKRVSVIGDDNFLGTYIVENGSIELIDDIGVNIECTTLRVGLSMGASMRTLPLIGRDPDSQKRYSKITVRCLNSSRPVINGERPRDRYPKTLQNTSEPLDSYRDYEVANLGFDRSEIINITEPLPIRCEVVGIFGKVQGNSL